MGYHHLKTEKNTNKRKIMNWKSNYYWLSTPTQWREVTFAFGNLHHDATSTMLHKMLEKRIVLVREKRDMERRIGIDGKEKGIKRTENWTTSLQNITEGHPFKASFLWERGITWWPYHVRTLLYHIQKSVIIIDLNTQIISSKSVQHFLKFI